jgi:serine O-acetyltransferase
MGFRVMCQRMREDFVLHGRSWRHRALWALALYRFGQWAMQMRPGPFRWLANKLYGTLSIFSPIVTGVALDRATKIGSGFHIVHPGMILIHPRATIGDRCGIMHGVTIGTSLNGGGGVPHIGDDVFIGAGAVLLGDITIGNGARIAANSLVMTDVPPGAMAIGVPAKIVPHGVWNGNRGMLSSSTSRVKSVATQRAGSSAFHN